MLVKERFFMRALFLVCGSLCLLSVSAYAGQDKAGGADFREAASEYNALAQKYSAKGQQDKAKIYARLAEIKINAAKLADQGRWDEISWDEYHALSAKLHKGKK